ncbi:MAG TPA: lytic transglycosylase domain-containing protein [Vicinamibacterales bacterium]|nr:lytic transglycosylase domain-containing protein [Vicinamibacterales bacterium]
MRPNPLAMLAGLAAGLVFVSATPAQADVVRLTNGRTMTVDRARFDGEIVILLMRGGGEIRAPRSLVEELLPDEEPWARTAALRALANSPTAAAPRPDADALRAMVDRVARRVGVSPRLAHALVRVESNYNLLAVSHRGAMGLTQIMPAVARTYALRDPYDPEQNLEAGMRHLRRLLAKFPDVRRALAAYNAGETAVSRYGGVPPYRETQAYVQRIMAALR